MQSLDAELRPIDPDIALAIHQYLNRYGLKAAAAAFESECDDRHVKVGRNVPAMKTSPSEDVKVSREFCEFSHQLLIM
ncbi:hypothetical protein L596_002139 [Steinernema carpocapsae]|uniref:Uncharacterized protein n=1 Tax=Steinernema carpocapsae TaxID=34508 RepID=A0A4U8UR00_STECR|nr:hypothetical protein L596_002139 [Steinernema carpocapsae]